MLRTGIIVSGIAIKALDLASCAIVVGTRDARGKGIKALSSHVIAVVAHGVQAKAIKARALTS